MNTKIKDAGFGGKGSTRKLGAVVRPLPPQGEARKGAGRKQKCRGNETPEARAERLRLRREMSRTGNVGFTAVPNKRINAAIEAGTLVVQLNNPLLSGADARMEATRQVASGLPARQGCRYKVRPSKSDSAAYRNGGSITGDGSNLKPKRKSRAKKAAA